MAQPETKRVVVLTADAGFGHRRSAEAIVTALQRLHGQACAADLINPLDDPQVPAFMRHSQAGHDHLSRELRRPYGWTWNASRARRLQPGLSRALALMLAPALRDIVRRHRPDAVVTTYPLYHPALESALAAGPRRVPLIAVVTDLGSVHPLWFSRTAEACLVATQTVCDQATACGLSPLKVHITGVPVDLRLSEESRAAGAIRAELGWQPDRPALLAVGSRRVAGFIDTLRAVDAAGVPLQWAIVAGGDDELYAQLRALDWHMPAHLYNWVGNLPTLMHAADCLLSKAGGLIISEALACGLPLLLVDRLMDQEVGNADMVVRSGAGELALSPVVAASAVRRWLAQGGQVLAQHARNARALGRPRAAYDAAEHIWQATQRLL